MDLWFTGQETAALYGKTSFVKDVYSAIRQNMDSKTRTVGQVMHASWNSIGTLLYVEPQPGIKGGFPTRSQVQRAGKQLEKAGLIEIASEGKQLNSRP